MYRKRWFCEIIDCFQGVQPADKLITTYSRFSPGFETLRVRVRILMAGHILYNMSSGKLIHSWWAVHETIFNALLKRSQSLGRVLALSLTIFGSSRVNKATHSISEFGRSQKQKTHRRTYNMLWTVGSDWLSVSSLGSWGENEPSAELNSSNLAEVHGVIQIRP